MKEVNKKGEGNFSGGGVESTGGFVDAKSMSAEEMQTLISLAKKIIWLEPGVRERLQKAKVNVVPSNFYSDIPSVADIRESFEYREEDVPVFDNIFDLEALRSFIDVIQVYAKEFTPPSDGDRENVTGFYWSNPAFSRLDAMSYYCMIRHFKPKKILEIGSGFSTLVADAAIKANGFGEIVCIEPYPMDFLENIDSVKEIVREKVQDIPVADAVAMIDESDIWFIDSTHTVKIGSDCLYIYLKLMPEVKTKTIVHSHDIYLPFGMPKSSALNSHIYWTEQYLLYAYLLDNPKASVLFGSWFTHCCMNIEAKKLMEGTGVGTRGASFWYSLNCD
ncbi:class I SAM-dependent methyltransferase [Arenicella xantha]|uniref:Methyltransferase family protein n=1 Tax=Arenicella xantha TaxID=644221 RepID=A0A395JL27_9GAMM|nr:class I SAM-dependent methyltransferase [Arenicella xantha]RBP51496.1 methyltransferase family protein [Arenicella xantha]